MKIKERLKEFKKAVVGLEPHWCYKVYFADGTIKECRGAYFSNGSVVCDMGGGKHVEFNSNLINRVESEYR